MLAIFLSGFLGAGKTTTLVAAAKAFEESGLRVAAITNDQGTDLVDTQFVRDRLGAAEEIAGGCFCCRFDDLATVLAGLAERGRADVVIAEAVGSCTDITATVVRPMLRAYGDSVTIAPVTAVVDPIQFVQFDRQWSAIEPEPEIAYLYRKQLEDVDVVAINKADRFAADENRLLREGVTARCPHADVLDYSAITGARMDALIQVWMTASKRPARDLELDYGLYGRAEARLAWLNRVAELTARNGVRHFSPDDWTECFMDTVLQSCRQAGLSIGHIKVRVGTGSRAVKASIVDGDDVVHFDDRHEDRAEAALVTINARVQCEPIALQRLMDDAVAHANSTSNTLASASRGHAFRPAQPVPTFRIQASD